MKGRTARKADDEVLPRYDFAGGVRGKDADRVRKNSNFVLLEPGAHEMFPDSASVNRALRAVGELVKTAKVKRKKVVT